MSRAKTRPAAAALGGPQAPLRALVVRIVTLLLVGLLAACASVKTPPLEAEREQVASVLADDVVAARAMAFATGAAYLGAALRDDGDAVTITGLRAGPALRAGLREGDRLRAADGAALSARALREQIATSGPGTRITLEYERDGQRRRLVIPIGDRGAWSGPAAFRREDHESVRLPRAPSWYAAHQARLAAIATADDVAVMAALEGMLTGLGRAPDGYNRSPWVDAVLATPAALAAWPPWVTTRLGAAQTAAPRWQPAFCAWLAMPCAAADAPPQIAQASSLAAELAPAIERVELAFGKVPGGRGALAPDLAVLLHETAAGRLIHAQDGAMQAIAAMQASMLVRRAALLEAFATLVALAPDVAPRATAGAPVPAALAARVTGEVIGWAPLGGGYVVVGGAGANRYDMDHLYAVIDLGGDDHYAWTADVPLAVQFIDDRGGDDHYAASAGGPGAGLLGVAVLRDAAGDDHYRSELAGCGAGVFGFGLLVDRAGRDRYACAAWSSGAGLYGGGVLLDSGSEADIYDATLLSQGVGGPAGVGLLIDHGGDDYYRANGQVASAYGTGAVFLGLSQGVGYGLRPHDHGGIGVLYDLAGNDRYEAGEFSQGGGYFAGLGLLADDAGDDLYVGHRYAQGFAAHQAAGVLADDAGDDVYWSMTAAAQGVAWDQSQAWLIDAAGDDHYRAGWLSQGSAAHQSRASLFDGAGDDVYRAARNAQGHTGANGYHYTRGAPVYSVAVLHDAAGADRYNRAAPVDTAHVERGARRADAKHRGGFGAVIDDPSPP